MVSYHLHTCLRISPFRRTIHSEIRSSALSLSYPPFLDLTSRFFAPFSRRPFCPPPFTTRPESLNDACQKKSRFPSPLSLSPSPFPPAFTQLSLLSPPLFLSPLIERFPRRLFLVLARAGVEFSSLADTKQRIERWSRWKEEFRWLVG